MYYERLNTEVTMEYPVVVLESIQDDSPAEVVDGANDPQNQGGTKTILWVDKFSQLPNEEE